MAFGLRDSDLAYMLSVLNRFPEVRKAVIFGSRAKGNYKPGSDVDMAIFGEDVSFRTVARLHALLEEEGPMPYYIDIVDYTHNGHDALKAHIDRVGQVIFERSD